MRLAAFAWAHLAIVSDCRRNAAGADAARGQQGKLVVRRGLAAFDFCPFFNGSKHLGRAFHVTGRAEADNASVFTLRFERKEMIKGRDAVNAAGGQFQLVGDKEEEVVLQVTE